MKKKRTMMYSLVCFLFLFVFVSGNIYGQNGKVNLNYKDASFESPPRSGETTHTGATGFPATGRYPGILAVLKKSRIFASLIAKQGLTKLKRQNESLRNHRKNRRYRKQRFPLGKAYQTQIQSQFEDEAFLVGGGRPLDYPESIRRRNQDY